jgi:hypothetical protein
VEEVEEETTEEEVLQEGEGAGTTVEDHQEEAEEVEMTEEDHQEEAEEVEMTEEDHQEEAEEPLRFTRALHHHPINKLTIESTLTKTSWYFHLPHIL